MGLHRPGATFYRQLRGFCLYVVLLLLCYGVLVVFVCVCVYVIPNVSLVPLVQRTLFLCLRHDKFEIGVINVSQPPTALLFASR